MASFRNLPFRNLLTRRQPPLPSSFAQPQPAKHHSHLANQARTVKESGN